MTRYCRHISSAACIAAVLLAAGCVHSPAGDRLIQFSTIDALMHGIYDGDVTVGELLRHGDTGLGTFNALDGEMVILGGRCYQVTADRGILEVPESTRIPFAAVVRFRADYPYALETVSSFAEFEQLLDEQLQTPNLFYAVVARGAFDYVKTRSVPRQERPYPRLVDAAADQAIFERSNVSGTLIGFRCPPYAAAFNVPGYHVHFLSDDRRFGGHVLDFRCRGITFEIDELAKLDVVLPRDDAFYKADLSVHNEEELRRVEK